jgi:hypothetical protein
MELDEYNVLEPETKEVADKLRAERKGKKTLAIVGMAPTSCSLAPFDDLDVDLWGLNEMHAFAWFKRATAWFQMHSRDIFTLPLAKRKVAGHYDWLKTKHSFPIYMLSTFGDVPDSVEYPLLQMCEEFLDGITKGGEHFMYFTSTFAYEMALALHLGYERIEIYGFEMFGIDEYITQKPCAEFWIGLARGRGVEIYLPPRNQMLRAPLYGYTP